MGRRTAVRDEALRTQVLQPLHLQQPLLRGQLPEPARLRRLGGVERAEPGGARLAPRPVARPDGRRSVLPPVRRRLVRRRADGRLVVSHGDGRVLAAPAGMVRARCVLREGPGLLNIWYNSMAGALSIHLMLCQ